MSEPSDSLSPYLRLAKVAGGTLAPGDYVFEGYLVAAGHLLTGADARAHFGQQLRQHGLAATLKGYANPASILSPAPMDVFLRQRLEHAFPALHRCVEQLRGCHCQEAADHLSWMLDQRVCQMSPAGLYVCAFLPYFLESVGIAAGAGPNE